MGKSIWTVIVLAGALPVWGASAAGTRGSDGTGSTGHGAAVARHRIAEHPVSAAQAREILELTGTDPLRRQMLDEMLPYLKQMMPWLPESAEADFRRSLEAADFQGAMIRSFQQHLSSEDAAEIIAFYRTPAGRRMIAVLPQIMNEGQDAGAALGQKVMLEVVERHKAEIDAAAKSYHEAHPEEKSGMVSSMGQAAAPQQ